MRSNERNIFIETSENDAQMQNVKNDEIRLLSFFLVGYVEERLWWPIQSPKV